MRPRSTELDGEIHHRLRLEQVARNRLLKPTQGGEVPVLRLIYVAVGASYEPRSQVQGRNGCGTMSYRDVTRDRVVTMSLAVLVSYHLGLSETSRERLEESVPDVAEFVSNN